MNKLIFSLLSITILFSSCNSYKTPDKVAIHYDRSIPQLYYAVEEIISSYEQSGVEAGKADKDDKQVFEISFEIDTSLGFEAYQMKSEGKTLSVKGGDANGLMYAGLDISDWILLGRDLFALGTINEKPYIRRRGLRYNIPLDARTPSYDDTGDAAQNNIATVWEWDYWTEYLDQMAKNRYNLLTFWSLHPYPSWIKVPEYPDVALDNVCKYNGEVTALTDMKWKDIDIQNPQNLTVIKEIPIEEKTEFWKKVFQYAEDRGIDIFLFHWNVFVNGAEGKHGITWEQDNPVTVDYIRKSVKTTLLTFPNIKGIGVTAGEHINRNLKGKYATENWMWLTYGQGVMDAKKENPDLDVNFIFRRHWSDLDDIQEAFKNYDGEFQTSFKYSRARMYSSVKPPWFNKIYRETVDEYNIKCWLNVRNDDIFTFRWGDPLYAKEYLKNIPYDYTPGFYMGPDGYVWGREIVSKKTEEPRQLKTQKHWYRFMIWGRASYNPDLPESFYTDRLSLRFPEADPYDLYNTWRATSEIISWVDKIHFRQNDAQFSPEGCFDKSKFHDVNNFINIGSMPLQGVTSIADFANGEYNSDDITPFEVAVKLDSAARILIDGAGSITSGKNIELAETLIDFTALGYLGKYYANKIRGATHLALFRVNGEAEDKEKAIHALENAVIDWNNYSRAATSQYNPTLYARTQMLDWEAQLPHVKNDVEIARMAKEGDEVKVIDNNHLWKRDSRRF